MTADQPTGPGPDLGPGGLPYRPCAGIVLINGQGLVFAGRRIDRVPGVSPAWQMPQGGIDAGETPRDAALRELTEETGVAADQVRILGESADWITYDLPPEMLGRVWKGRYGGQRQKWFLMRLLAPDDAIDIATDHPEFDAWRWVAGHRLIDEIVPFKREVYRRVLAEFAPHLA